jgi:hypothetical protein
MSVADTLFPARQSLTEEELALLRHADLADDVTEVDLYDELRGHSSRPSFRERLALGDISW